MSKLRSAWPPPSLTALGVLLVVPAVGQAATNFGSRLNHDPTDTDLRIVRDLHDRLLHPAERTRRRSLFGRRSGRRRDHEIQDPGLRGGRTRPGHLPRRRHQPAGPRTTTTAPWPTAGGHRARRSRSSPTKRRWKRRSPRSPRACRSKKASTSRSTRPKSIGAVYNSNGSKFSYVYSPPLVDGSGARGSNETANELLVAATIEPDADGDGFGDETQDQCPTQATTQGACDADQAGGQRASR